MSKVIEIPQGKRSFRYRFFEILPFVLSVLMVVLLPILSWISPVLGSIYLLLIVIMNLVKAVGIAYRMIQGQGVVKASVKVDWQERMRELDSASVALEKHTGHPRKEYGYNDHIENLRRIVGHQQEYPKSTDIWHAVIVTMYNEGIDVLEPTLESVANVSFD
ncbi:MAG: hypothetical protein II670_14445, partial [Alphaproteobacteria bacterium]|nr:hypothetical protein [Alphaproteobacteria bacterium]